MMKSRSDSIPEKVALYDLPELIDIVIADDHAHIRQAIRRLISTSHNIHIVGEARNGFEALDLVERLLPDVLLLDLEMPEFNGLQVTERLISLAIPTRILILSGYAEQAFIQTLLSIGAKGYLTKDEAPDLILQAIAAVAANQGGWLSASARQSLID